MAKRGLCMTQTGTPYYASPEVIWVAGHWDGSLKRLYYDTVDGSEIRRYPQLVPFVPFKDNHVQCFACLGPSSRQF